MNSELGRLALASSLISDLFSNLGLTVFSTLRIGFLAEITTVISVQSFVLLLGIILLIVAYCATSFTLGQKDPRRQACLVIPDGLTSGVNIGRQIRHLSIWYACTSSGDLLCTHQFSFQHWPARCPQRCAAALAFIMTSQAALSHFCVGSLYDHTRIYAGYQKRDIQHASSTSELRLLSCAHRFDDVVAVRKLLDASFPCKESPLSVYALHLVELAGRASPVLIDHQLGQKNTWHPRSQKIVEVFQSSGNQYLGSATTHFFTSMSLPRFMHQDICSLAFDKLASMIILPFHRKWNQQGKIILDSSNLRTINNNVLDMAPCSVGILIDRQKIKRLASQSGDESSPYQVAVVFMGGNDDREALAYAKRMSRSPEIQLTVVRFVSWDIDVRGKPVDAVLDAEMLKEVRLGQHQDNIVYREERVKDGAETALIIHAMEEAFDLIMVGRRHRDDLQQLLGLNEWNDLPELGPVGDMLAAAEINRPVSVLVVQHQIVKSK
ncbi:hypothetical protein HAX54_036924 [Datura stramonium]|uniref:Uncharacterized protein n=1 Tax=Datura stramonium TaxID=4076 RepID=A0ABS8VJW3_DATST|nr:hypothetical protein [Datura stramonium]